MNTQANWAKVEAIAQGLVLAEAVETEELVATWYAINHNFIIANAAFEAAIERVLKQRGCKGVLNARGLAFVRSFLGL